MRRPRRFQTAVRLIIALFALVGQSAVASISSEPDTPGAAAHVERSGVALHHAHNEATCLVCRVLSIHGRFAGQPSPAVVIVAAHFAPQGARTFRHERDSVPNNLSRAPPENA